MSDARTKDSGVKWLGEIPAHWDVLPIKAFTRRKRVKNHPELQLLSVYRDYGVIPKDSRDDNYNRASADLSSYQVVEIGDLAINKMKSWQGSLGVSQFHGIVSPAYIVCELNGNVYPRFIHHLLRSSSYIAQYACRSYGIRPAQWDMRYVDFREILALIPPLDEQRAIAAYLDRETNRIDALIAKTLELNALLSEKLIALISNSVTKGLDPAVPLRGSGVKWLGDIPAHWEVTRIKHLATGKKLSFVDGDWIESPYIVNSGIRLIQTGNIGIGEYREQGFHYISEETFEELDCTEVFPGDVLICRLAAPVGRACMAPDLSARMITSVDVCILRPSMRFDPRFVVYSLSSFAYLAWLEALARGSTRDRVSRSMLGDVEFMSPPPAEQRVIANYLDRETAKMKMIITRNDDLIALLREKRKWLIGAAVTGKIDLQNGD